MNVNERKLYFLILNEEKVREMHNEIKRARKIIKKGKKVIPSEVAGIVYDKTKAAWNYFSRLLDDAQNPTTARFALRNLPLRRLRKIETIATEAVSLDIEKSLITLAEVYERTPEELIELTEQDRESLYPLKVMTSFLQATDKLQYQFMRRAARNYAFGR